jgi:tripartite motif-containing protein 71
MDVHTSDDFATLLRRHRLAIGLTQEELAEQAHFSARGISDLERGVTTRPHRDTLQLLIKALQLTVEQRAELTAAARAVRAAPGKEDARWEAPGDHRDGVSSAGPAYELRTMRPRERVSVPARSTSAPSQRRAHRLPALARRTLPPRTMLATVTLLVLVIIASGGIVGQRLIRRSGDARVHLIFRGSFIPWGMALSSHTNPVVHLSNAFRVAVDRQGNIYVTEGSGLYTGNIPRDHVDIVKLSPTGRILARWGHFGSRPGEFNQPAGVVIDPHGNVYVADYGNDRVQKFSPSGKVLAVWGSFGTTPGHFDLPLGIALDSHGNIYVTDHGNNRVQKLSPSGKVLAVWGHGCGSQPGQFCDPTDVAVGPSDRVYIVDYGNYRIQALSPTGRPLDSWSPPSNPINYNGPSGLAIDTRGEIYLTNLYGAQVAKFTASGVSLGRWNVGSSSAIYALPGLTVDPTGHPIMVSCGVVSCDRLYRSSPDGLTYKPLAIATPPTPARFDHPSLLAVDRNRAVYVITGNSENHLQKLSPSGLLERLWGRTTFNPSELYDLTGLIVDVGDNVYVSDVLSGHILKVSPSGKLLQRWGSEGSGPGQFETPYGLTVDTLGNVYVADTGNDRIQKLSAAGRPIARWGQSGTAPGQFNAPRAVAVDAQGTMYVADTGNHRIQKLSPSGKSLAVWGPTLTGASQFKELTGVALDSRGNVYGVDAVDNQVTELSPTGTVIARWGTKGARPGQFQKPEGVVVDQHSNVYVADTENNRIQKLSVSDPASQ